MAAALVSLGRKQLTELAEDPNGIELTCQFCDSRHGSPRRKSGSCWKRPPKPDQTDRLPPVQQGQTV